MPTPSRAILPVLPALLLLSGCGDIEVKSTRIGNAVPTQLQGAWSGSWASTQGPGTGTVSLQVQAFDGEPLVQVLVDNPCLVPRDYQLRMSGASFELLADGQAVFAAVLGPERTLVGTFGCSADAGVWQATWTADLPPILDLGGVWQGEVRALTLPATELVVSFVQTVRGGQLVVDGTLTAPGLLPSPLPMTGTVRFHAASFEVAMRTADGIAPTVQIAGLGDLGALAIEDGLLVASAIPQLPSGMATWDLAFQRR